MSSANFVVSVLQGKTVYRILLNNLIREKSLTLSGRVLDLGGGHQASYRQYLPPGIKLTVTDLEAGSDVERVIDFNQSLPFADSCFNSVLLINALYIVKDRLKLLSEIKRVLAPGGKLLIASPFIANEMPEPDDFCRLTYSGLERELTLTGFSEIKIERFGERFTAAAYLLHPAFYFSLIRLIAYSLAILLDKFIPRRIKEQHPTPLGYICLAAKV